MEEARTSGLECRSMHFKQIILTGTEVGKLMATDCPLY